jgi:hypothetical protein
MIFLFIEISSFGGSIPIDLPVDAFPVACYFCWRMVNVADASALSL